MVKERVSWHLCNSSFIPEKWASVGAEVSSKEIKTFQLDWETNRYASIIFTCKKREVLDNNFLTAQNDWKVYEFRCQCID